MVEGINSVVKLDLMSQYLKIYFRSEQLHLEWVLKLEKVGVNMQCKSLAYDTLFEKLNKFF